MVDSKIDITAFSNAVYNRAISAGLTKEDAQILSEGNSKALFSLWNNTDGVSDKDDTHLNENEQKYAFAEVDNMIDAKKKEIEKLRASGNEKPPFEATNDEWANKLKEYNFKRHSAKPNVGTIKVNGEAMMIKYNNENGSYSLMRVTGVTERDGKKVPTSSWTEYSSITELLNAFNDEKNEFGKYHFFRQ